MRALISVSDKTGILELAKNLTACGVELISTGGTYKTIVDSGIEVIEISAVTEFPECLNGRVKTLHPKIHAGILAKRDDKAHMDFLSQFSIETIDIVIVNLYPFKQTILKPGTSLEEAVENIDIGGPAMLRSAAKNYKDVAVVVDPADYKTIIEELKENGKISDKTKFYLSAKVFMHTAHYDSLIANYLKPLAGIEEFPDTLTLTYEKIQPMRYGENPQQNAAFYKEVSGEAGQLVDIVQLHGKELSFNNINDTHGALELLREYSEPTVVVCKHSNPCGVGSAENIFEAYMKAFKADPVSIFGGIIVANREVDDRIASEVSKLFIEIILAPSFSESAIKILSKKKNIRILVLENLETKQSEDSLDLKKVSGGLLVQKLDLGIYNEDELKVVTERKPTEKEMDDLLFAWKIVKFTKSNSIVIGKDKQSIGIGVGQVSRIWACKQAIDHGLEHLGESFVKGSVMASEALFPFADCVEAAAAAGITAIIQPGGSVRDQDSIDECNKHGIAMIFTNVRHFRH